MTIHVMLAAARDRILLIVWRGIYIYIMYEVKDRLGREVVMACQAGRQDINNI